MKYISIENQLQTKMDKNEVSSFLKKILYTKIKHKKNTNIPIPK